MYPPYNRGNPQDLLLFRDSLRESFPNHVATCIPRDSRGYSLICSALTTFFDEAGVTCQTGVEDALLRILLGNALAALSSARSVTSSYRMTNKAGRDSRGSAR